MKFPRTPHLPGSRGTEDDLFSEYSYKGPVVLTEKLDGSNVMINSQEFITRKGSTSNAPWTWPMREIQALHSPFIPKGFWIAGEFLYWQKTVEYKDLPYPYLAFGGVKGNKVLSFEDSQDLAKKAHLPFVKVLETFPEGLPKDFKPQDYLEGNSEGFVVRPLESFPLPKYGDFVSKFVRSDFQGTAGSEGMNSFLRTPADLSLEIYS